eukprot:scaffold153_cov347-Pavlova_lutheri.AAC.10
MSKGTQGLKTSVGAMQSDQNLRKTARHRVLYNSLKVSKAWKNAQQPIPIAHCSSWIFYKFQVPRSQHGSWVMEEAT